MTNDDIIRMAREACGDEHDPFVSEWITFDYAELERFAALVAAAEREKFLAFLRQMHDAYALTSVPPRSKT